MSMYGRPLRSSAGEIGFRAWRTSHRSTAGNEPAMCLPHLASARNRARGRRPRACAAHEPPLACSTSCGTVRSAKVSNLSATRSGNRRSAERNCHRSESVARPAPSPYASRHLALAVRFAMPTARPDAGERTRSTMARSRLTSFRSHCDRRESGSGEDDLEMILFTLHPLHRIADDTAIDD